MVNLVAIRWSEKTPDVGFWTLRRDRGRTVAEGCSERPEGFTYLLDYQIGGSPEGWRHCLCQLLDAPRRFGRGRCPRAAVRWRLDRD